MSKRDVEEYYDIVSNQYVEMLDAIRELEEECRNGLVAPEHIDNMKQLITPLKNNYETLSWIMFLLNKPVRKAKHRRYEQANSKLINSLDKNRSKEAVINENKEVIDELSSKSLQEM